MARGGGVGEFGRGRPVWKLALRAVGEGSWGGKFGCRRPLWKAALQSGGMLWALGEHIVIQPIVWAPQVPVTLGGYGCATWFAGQIQSPVFWFQVA
jgi:hypothetical protein